MATMDYNKYENYIRVGHTATQDSEGNYVCTDLENFPTPSALSRTLHDVDKDAFTDLEGYTQRNRVRHDVEDLQLSYSILSDNDEAYILNRISPEWFYVELTDKKTKQKVVHKMYASDKAWDVFKVSYDNVTDDNGYIKYTDGNLFYWYDSELNVIYDEDYVVVGDMRITELTKVKGDMHEETAEFTVSFVEQ